MRIYIPGALNSWSRIAEVEAYADSGGVSMTLPSAFAKMSPANAAIEQPLNPVLSWAASNGAASYQYCIDTTNNNACDTGWISTASTNASIQGLNGGTS